LKRALKIFLWTFAAVAAVAVFAGVAVWRELTMDLPPVEELLDYRPPAATRVYAADGTQIGEFYVERRYLMPIAEVPDHVKLAFLASEDAEFYKHRGVNPASIARALIANLQRGEVVQGASTITQQVVKQLLLSPERTLERKIKELILAIELESKLSKDDILYLYLNHIYFGAGTYGLSAAAQTLFGKEVGQLSLAEAALLAGLPQAPSRYDPLRRPYAAIDRQHYVLDRMAAVGFITVKEREAALAQQLWFQNAKVPTYVAAPWYVEHVRRLLEEQFGPEFADLGLHVKTAVDLHLQSEAEETLSEGLRKIERRLGVHSDDPNAARVEGALIAIDPASGQVKALVGGIDFQRSQFNRAVLARRQPGSAFKPLIYAAAIDHGYTAATIVQDAPISLPDGRRGYWSPKNFENKYMGAVPLRTALANSLNTVSVRLAMSVGLDTLRSYLRLFGFSVPFPRNYSLALGSSEVTPFELARAYGVFATLGRKFEPVFITAIEDANGDPVDFPGSEPHFEAAMNPATAYIVTRMLESVVESGTGREARKLGRPAAGKTGTTNDSKDAWFVGYTPELLTTVWLGFDANRALGSYTGGRAAAPIWTAFMQRALDGQPERDFEKPGNVSLVKIDTATGLKAVSGRSSREEAFVAGTEPNRFAPRPVAPTPAPELAQDVAN
jgi:penicillin-binding protein 1A